MIGISGSNPLRSTIFLPVGGKYWIPHSLAATRTFCCGISFKFPRFEEFARPILLTETALLTRSFAKTHPSAEPSQRIFQFLQQVTTHP